MDLKFYLDMTEFIVNRIGISNSEKAYVRGLQREIKECMKKGRSLNSYWKLVALKLFEVNKIKDERISEDILNTVEWKHEGKTYVTKVKYIDFEINKFPPQSRMLQNTRDVDDAVFIIESLKSCVDKYGDDVVTDRVYMLQKYILVLLEETPLENE